ncbi:MAG: aminoglycoside phosphotransferase family protein [Mycobacterium sp.]|nr:aminoglycoside phosphotransferase family protein [Mycobacterium sp.]
MSVSEVGLSAMIADIAPGATARRVRPMSGGLAAATYAVDTSAGEVVVKVYPPGHEGAQLEWDGLNFAQRVVGVPRPEPIALDVEGRWFGSPTVVMSRLPGRGDVSPADLDGWLKQIAHALAAIHETDIAGASGCLLRPAWGNRAPGIIETVQRSALVERCVEAIRRHLPAPGSAPILMHGDFHPGNIIWRDGTLTGVLDWGGTRLGSRWFDLAYCRGDVALLFGMRGVRILTEHYVSIAGRSPVDLPVFDLMCGLAARQLGAQWLRAFRHQGCTDTPRQFAARVTPFLRQALAELGA